VATVPEEFLGTDELAERWDTSVRVIYGMRYRGEGPPALRIGRELRFRLSDVEAWELERLEAPKSDTPAPLANDATRRTESRRRQVRRDLRKKGARDDQTSA
jgi:predicted DNA-binding transcriptional regulator AlpA